MDRDYRMKRAATRRCGPWQGSKKAYFLAGMVAEAGALELGGDLAVSGGEWAPEASMGFGAV